MKDIETVVSDNIKKLLKEYNVNQTELSKIAGVSESTVGKWVLKKATPRMGAVQKISDHFQIPKSYILEEGKEKIIKHYRYSYYPVTVAAGLPSNIEGITNEEVKQIEVPSSVMGKYAGSKDIFLMRVNGESMNNIIPNGSLIAVKSIELSNIKEGDIVVYSDGNNYSVKRFYKDDVNLIFRPDSKDPSFYDYITDITNENLVIHGKVVVYIVELD